VKRLSELAALFPVQWLGGNLHAVIEEGPATRRHLLDWGLFHVKPSYIGSWKRFQKLLKQRNAAIRQRSGPREIQVWDSELAQAGEQLDIFRQDYLQALLPEIAQLGQYFPVIEHAVAVDYKKGWPKDSSFSQALSANLEKDRDCGFTSTGPQRADLVFSYNGKPARERLSRGQQKVYVVALQLAQATLLYKATGKTSLFLFDDLGAELDAANQANVLKLLRAIDAQVFVTSINKVNLSGWSAGEAKLFHVKHGNVTEML
jgi:DNA replication and repair protein RecF